MSEQFVTYAGNKAQDVPAPILKDILRELLIQADYVMDTNLNEDDFSMLIKWLIEYLMKRFGYLPLHHIRAAIENGSTGQRGGTSKLNPRNVIIWLTEQDRIYSTQVKREHEKRDAEIASTKRSPEDIAAGRAYKLLAVWRCDGRINDAKRSRVDEGKLIKLILNGIDPKDITPTEVMR